MPVYIVGIEYDDFDDVGFSIVSVCDDVEVAKTMVEKIHQDFPSIDKNSITIRTLKLNKFYNDWI